MNGNTRGFNTCAFKKYRSGFPCKIAAIGGDTGSITDQLPSITSVNVNGNIIETKSGFNDYGDTRVWGFYTDKDAAIEALHFNSTDMNETCYEYACLEAYDEGISNCRPHETQWFKFDHNINGYFEIETPILEKRICGRAMG